MEKWKPENFGSRKIHGVTQSELKNRKTPHSSRDGIPIMRSLRFVGRTAIRSTTQRAISFRSVNQTSRFSLSCNSNRSNQSGFTNVRSFHTSNAMLNKRDHYEVLGVDKNADSKAIKSAFYKLAKKYHPDANQGDKECEKKFAEVSSAYEVLSDEEKRRNYDQFGHDADQMGGDGGNPFGGMSPEDIFSNIFGGGMGGMGGNPFGGFGGGGGGRQSNRPQRGNDIQTSLRIPFMDAVKGCKRTVKVRSKDPCDPCTGSGVQKGTSKQTCRTCNGAGATVQQQGPFQFQMPCQACDGEGHTQTDCSTCRGSGFKSVLKEVDVSIPGGVDNDSNVRLRDQGDTGRNGGPRGHLFMQIRVDPDPRFQREGQDIRTKVPISFMTAAIGGKVTVPTLDNDVILKVDSGTQPGDVRRMRGKGIRHVSGRSFGDQYVHFDVKIPKKLSPRAIELIQELATELPSEEGGLATGEELGPPPTEGILGKVKDWLGSQEPGQETKKEKKDSA